VRRLLGTILLLAAAVAAFWLFRDPLMERFRGRAVDPDVPSEALAERAEAKLEALAAGAEARVALGGAELQSLLQYRYAGFLPDFLAAPELSVAGDRVRVQARVPTDRLPRLAELGPVAAFLPDTADLVLRGQVVPLPGGGAALAVDDVTAARIPLPRRFIGPALDRLGRRDQAGLPPDAIPLPLPPGAASMYVRGDSLVLLRQAAGDTP
jgi:hypothetical protein